MAAAVLTTGQRLQGRYGAYTIIKNLHKNIWSASANGGTVIVKTAPLKRLHNERDMLQMFQSSPHIRPLLDQIRDPPALILKHLEGTLLEASNAKKLKPLEIKFVARRILEALSSFHEAGYAHTDIKPDNVLVNCDGTSENRFSEVQLGDCADAYRIDPNADPLSEGHIISAAIFRSPEANLQLRWGTATDIWSFGATLISLIWGQNWHIFIPKGYSVDDPDYPTQVLVKQASIFGPFPPSYAEIADEERQSIITVVNNYIEENQLQKPFSRAEDPELTVEDREFICKIMKIHPKDRPTAKELLKDPWFD